MNDDSTTPEPPAWPASPPRRGQPEPDPDGTAAPDARSHRRWWTVGVATIAVVALSAAGGAAAEYALHHDSSSESPRSVSTVSPGFGGSQLPDGSAGSQPYGGFGGSQGYGGYGGFGGRRFSGGSDGSSSGGTSGGSSRSTSLDVSGIASKVDPAVVNIDTKLQGGEAAGTGIVITSSGEVLTNNHVINGATSVRVEIGVTGKTYTANVVGYDVADDVALLKLQGASGMKTADLGDSSQVAANDEVVAIGNALGRFGTPSAVGGVVTATQQTITAGDANAEAETLTGMIQVQASIQPGDSGGPLVNTSGKVIGVDTAADTGSGRFGYSSGNTGFAIPINKAMSIAHQIESGHSSARVHIGSDRALLGVALDTSGSSGYGYGFGSSDSTGSGAAVAQVETGGAADKVGIQSGDTIVAVDGTTITTPSQLSAAVNAHKPGDTISITWQDSNGTQHHARAKLGSGPPA